MTRFSNSPGRRPIGVRHAMLRALLTTVMLGGLAVGCTATDPRSDDSDVFGSQSPAASPPSPSPS